MKIYLGLDPGATGAIGVIWPDGRVSVYDLNDSPHDTWDTLNEITAGGECSEYCIAVLESVGATPQMGVTSAFNFGGSARSLEMALIAAGVHYSRVSPAKWKKGVFDGDLYPRGREQAEQKQAARDQARRLFPAAADQLKRVKDAGRAEALLMAEYARRNDKG